METQLFALDAMGLMCRTQSMLHCNMLNDAPANVRQEILMVLVLAFPTVDVKYAMEALQAAVLVVKLVIQPPPHP